MLITIPDIAKTIPFSDDFLISLTDLQDINTPMMAKINPINIYPIKGINIDALPNNNENIDLLFVFFILYFDSLIII